MTEAAVPEIVRQAASRIAGTALGPFIMGERHVDLDALEQRINDRVIEEMQLVMASILSVMAKTSVFVVVEDYTEQLKAAPKKRKATKKPG